MNQAARLSSLIRLILKLRQADNDKYQKHLGLNFYDVSLSLPTGQAHPDTPPIVSNFCPLEIALNAFYQSPGLTIS
jgi:hypothetical protein